MAAKRVVIVGGVAGGAAAAARLRRLDETAEICILERGGDVSFANCGLPYFLGGLIPKRQQLLVATPERFRDWFRIEVRTRHEAQAIDRAARTVTVRDLTTGADQTMPYDALVLAPGAAPIRPRLPGIDLAGVFMLRTLDDADRIQAWLADRPAGRAVVVGGGYIGLEMVENLARRKMEVTVLELSDQVMLPMDPEMVVPAHEELRRQGIDLRLSTGLQAIEQGPGETLVAVDQHGQRIAASIVMVAAGVKPDVELARAAGLEIGARGGIRVNDQMQTSDAAIWAVGDAVEVRDYVTRGWTLVALAGPAARQGRIAADAICGRQARYRGSQGTGVVGLFGLTLALTGASEKTLRREGIPFAKSYTHSADHASYYPGAQMMVIKLLYAPADGRILGAQAVGCGGVEKRIDVLAMAIQQGATIFDLEEAELCYAPQYGSAKDPVNMAGFVAGNILRGDVDPVQWSDWQALEASAAELPLVVDVRQPSEWAAGHVPGAVNLPLPELRGRLDELPRDREVWVHCGVGQRSYYASRILRQNGFRVRNLSGGFKTYKSVAEK